MFPLPHGGGVGPGLPLLERELQDVDAVAAGAGGAAVDGRGAVGPGDLLADSAGYGVASAVAAHLALEPGIPWLEVSD